MGNGEYLPLPAIKRPLASRNIDSLLELGSIGPLWKDASDVQLLADKRLAALQELSRNSGKQIEDLQLASEFNHQALNIFLQHGRDLGSPQVLCQRYADLMLRLTNYVYQDDGYLVWLTQFAQNEALDIHLRQIDEGLPRFLVETLDRVKATKRIWDKIHSGIKEEKKTSPNTPKDSTLAVNVQLRKKSQGERYLQTDILTIPCVPPVDKKVVEISPTGTGVQIKLRKIDVYSSETHDPDLNTIMQLEHQVDTSNLHIDQVNLAAVSSIIQRQDLDEQGAASSDGLQQAAEKNRLLRARAKTITGDVATALLQNERSLGKETKFEDYLYAMLTHGLAEPSEQKLLGHMNVALDTTAIATTRSPGSKNFLVEFPSDIGTVYIYSDSKLEDLAQAYLKDLEAKQKLNIADLSLDVPQQFTDNILDYLRSLEGLDNLEVETTPELMELVVRSQIRELYLNWQEVIASNADVLNEKWIPERITRFYQLVQWLGNRTAIEANVIFITPDPDGKKPGIARFGNTGVFEMGTDDFGRKGFDKMEYDNIDQLKILWNEVKSHLNINEGLYNKIESSLDEFCRGSYKNPLYPQRAAELVRRFGIWPTQEALSTGVTTFRCKKNADNIELVSTKHAVRYPQARVEVRPLSDSESYRIGISLSYKPVENGFVPGGDNLAALKAKSEILGKVGIKIGELADDKREVVVVLLLNTRHSAEVQVHQAIGEVTLDERRRTAAGDGIKTGITHGLTQLEDTLMSKVLVEL